MYKENLIFYLKFNLKKNGKKTQFKMDDENYRIEKLNFVSNLKGTTIDRIINIMIIVPLIYLVSILVKPSSKTI